MSKVTHAKLVIIGSGPAGCTAAIYAARAMLEPIMIRGVQAGGQLTITTDVENYPGFAEVIQGPWLMEQMEKQAAHVGTRLVADHVTKLDLSQRPFRLECDSRRRLPGRRRRARDRRAGALARSSLRAEVQGLSASRPARPATASSIAARRSFVIGGGNTAVEEALFLTNFAAQGHGRASARSFPRREDPAGSPVQESEDRGDLGHGAARRRRRRESAEGARASR